MATTPKLQKDKAHMPAPAPRLQPRPTAASAARAARNATNRNLAQQPSQRQSPTRPTRVKSPPTMRYTVKSDSKTDTKIRRPFDNEVQDSNYDEADKQEPATFLVTESPTTTLIADDRADEHLNYPTPANHQGNFESAIITPERSESNEKLRDNEPGPLTVSRSRPHTPAMAMNGRALTYKNLESSRPQTPHMLSRPTTPAHPAQRASPLSRPNTPQHAHTTEPRTPSTLPVPSPTRVFTPNMLTEGRPITEDEEDVKSVYTAKQKQFQRLKKELDMKQQAVLDVFDSLRNLNERMSREGTGGGEGVQMQDLVVFNVGDWPSAEIAQLCRDAAATPLSDGNFDLITTSKPIDENVLDELDSSVLKIPSNFAELCLQAFTARQELIDWLKELIGASEEDGRGESLERIARYNAHGLELCEALRNLKSRADDAVDTVTQLSRRACRERTALIAVGETLVREVARLRQDVDARSCIVNEMREIHVDNETAQALEDTRCELEEERAARSAMKEKLATTEAQLRQTRFRVTKMDRQLREAEASISNLTGTVKTLEDQSRQKEVQLESRARKLKESLKTGEVVSSQISQQRDQLQAEVQSLKDQIETMTAQHKKSVLDLNKEIKDLKSVLEEQMQLAQKEMELRKSCEGKLSKNHASLEELKAKYTELENSRPNPDIPTKREMDLWAELQAIKDTLRMTEDEVIACKREKVRFLETLTKISESENKVGLQQKLAAELLSKEEIIGKMQIQMRELTKNMRLNEQKVIQYEQYVRDLQAHNRAVANCQVAPNGISYQDLQQEIMNLRMSLLETVHRNEELSEYLAQKEQQLEQQDKTSRAQARVIKVREELINMLKNKETEQSRELSALQQDLEHRMKIVDEVNKQIAAKAEEIQELFATLENKQQQIHRLEKIVLALEEQQRRAQAQRTRHEEKIAALEHELAAGNRRERKFIFF